MPDMNIENIHKHKISLLNIGMYLQIVIMASTMWYLCKSREFTCDQSVIAFTYIEIFNSIMCLILLIGVIIERKWIFLWIPLVSWFLQASAMGAGVH